LLGVLDETWHGTPIPESPLANPEWSYYSDEQAGFKQSLAIPAQEAQFAVGGTSIAQHAKHSAVGARIFAAWLRDEQPAEDWGSSFNVSGLDAASWGALQDELWSSLGELRRAVENYGADSDARIGTAVGAVAHLVYHLGAIRQKLLLVKSSANIS
jgi:hypothetical protein